MPRSYSHNYRSRCIYHITLKKAPGVAEFGSLCGEYPDAVIARSRLGAIIEKNIRLMPDFNPAIKVLQYCIMPDHVHLLIFVTSVLDHHLGNYIGKLKVNIHQDYRNSAGIDLQVFEDDFYDCILYRSRSLDTLYKYIHENPRRLAIRKAHPDFFRRMNHLRIGDKNYQAYGNVQLLDNPFKEQVVVHRNDSAEIREHNRKMWLHTAANGGVLVSPFISADEKKIRDDAETDNGRFILITNEPLPERFKPTGRDFELCETGRLLIVSINLPGELSRRTCLAMNSLAEVICADKCFQSHCRIS